MAENAHRRRGRPYLGEREELKARVPKPLKEAAREAARRRGLSDNDYLMALIAADLGYDDLARLLNQEVLPISAA